MNKTACILAMFYHWYHGHANMDQGSSNYIIGNTLGTNSSNATDHWLPFNTDYLQGWQNYQCGKAMLYKMVL